MTIRLVCDHLLSLTEICKRPQRFCLQKRAD